MNKWRLVAVLAAAIIVLGCTCVKYKGMSYYSVLQKKKLRLEITSGTITQLEYATDSSPTEQAFEAGLRAGKSFAP